MSGEVASRAQWSIRTGSKSFAAAARLFAPQTRRSATLLYAWCRYCDDLVDGQELGHTPACSVPAPPQTLAFLKAGVHAAYEGGPQPSPAFAALRETVLRHEIPRALPLQLLEGFSMDLRGRDYETIEDTLEYCYHVAGVVGLMMAMIMGVREKAVLDRACDLGLAFQLTNIARDLVEDARMGRCYVPERWLREAGLSRRELTDERRRPMLASLAQRLLETAEPYYASALAGLAALPFRSAWAVAGAHGIYREIGVKLLARGAAAWDTRSHTGKQDKARLLMLALLRAGLRRYRAVGPRPAELWRRPPLPPPWEAPMARPGNQRQ